MKNTLFNKKIIVYTLTCISINIIFYLRDSEINTDSLYISITSVIALIIIEMIVKTNE